MGLGISVGLRCDLAQNDSEGFEYHSAAFEQLTRALAREGIEWREPEVLHERGNSDFSASFPYSYLMHLRRLYTLVERGEPVTSASAVSAEQYDQDREKVLDESTLFASHLLCHADDGGYYIPVAFDDPLFLPEEAGIDGGGMVGSSQRLLAELAGFADALDIQLEEGGALSASHVEAVNAADDSEPFAAERYTWVQLYRACLASVESGHAIVFG